MSDVIAFLGHVSPGWIVLLALAALAFFDSIRGGTARTTALALAFPLSYVLLQFIPSALFMGDIAKQFSSSVAQGVLAAIVLGVSFVLLYRLTDNFASDTGFLQALTGALGLMIMTALFWQLIPAFNTLWSPGAQFAAIFTEAYRLWWLLGSTVLLAVSRG
jgi:hypothetical protein